MRTLLPAADLIVGTTQKTPFENLKGLIIVLVGQRYTGE